MTKFIMTVGLPASGKSTFSKELAERENATLYSSDEMRIELYGDVNHNEDNGKLFEEIYKRVREDLKSGKSVVVDATNISSKRRIGVLQQFRKYEKECHYFVTPFKECVRRNLNRDRIVPLEAMDRMYKTLQVPAKYEGWDAIALHHDSDLDEQWNPFGTKMLYTHDSLFDNLSGFHEYFNDIYNLPQDTKYHSFSASRHTFYVYKYIEENYIGKDRDAMLWAGLLHDIGKGVCKNFKDGNRYANFLGHENVSAQMAVEILRKAGYEDSFILKVANIVQLHMRLLQNKDSEKANSKLNELVGESMYQKLIFFKEADLSAK